jgi:YggT family protein
VSAEALVQIVSLAIGVFQLLLLARILMGWINVDPYHPVVRFLYNATEPILAPVRKVIPPAGMFDLSPMVVFIGVIILEAFLISLIRSIF